MELRNAAPVASGGKTDCGDLIGGKLGRDTFFLDPILFGFER